MSSEMYERMRANPKFQELVTKRGRFAWTLAITVLSLFYGFVMVVAFAPAALAVPVAEGSKLTVGVAAGLSMFAFFWALTALYVRRANGEFDALTAEIVKEASKAESALKKAIGVVVLLAIPRLARAAGALEGVTEKQPLNVHAIAMFVVFVALTMGITYWASSRTKSTADFYTAGGGITGFQNGLAIAGDYMSAATLLGLTAMTYSQGFDGYMYMIAFFVGWPVILFLMAERLRNLGRFTFADITSYRLDQGKVRTMAAISSLTVVCFYLIAQMVGAGQLIKLLFGLEYKVAIIAVGGLMMVYVIFGGMIATTWVQIIKAGMLLVGGTLVMILAMSRFGFSYSSLVEQATSVHKLGAKLMAPGPLLSDPVNAISLGMGLMFGTAGLPHILMRFFTVTDAKEARKSVLYASGFVGYFFNVIFLMGLSAILIVGRDPSFFEGGMVGGKIVGGGNMVAMHLAKAVGGNLLLGFLAAVAFATILAVVAGLTITAATSFAHDIYASVINRHRVTEDEQVRVSRITVVVLGIFAIGLGILAAEQNIAFLVALAFAVAAAANLPTILYSLYWPRFNTRGALWSMYGGLISTIVLIVFSPAVSGAKTAMLPNVDFAWFPLANPGIVSIPLAFILGMVGTLTSPNDRGNAEIAAEMEVRSLTGIGAEKAVAAH
jgi:cation/acetate symporter